MSETCSLLGRIGVRFLLAAAILLVIAAVPSARAQTLTTLYSFTGGADGASPMGDLVRDAQGNLYGTTSSGAANCGTVYELTEPGTFEMLHTFTGADGCAPCAGLARDEQGNLYGTTWVGGAYGWGTVFVVTPSGTTTVLHDFTGGMDGGTLRSSVILDAQGNLYGTTLAGGGCGNGTVFELAPSGKLTVLHSFRCMPSTVRTSDGRDPWAGLIFDNQSNLYGTTYYGGAYGWGTVFKVNPNKRQQWDTALYNFTGGADGELPRAGLVLDGLGNLFGTTSSTVFEITASGRLEVLHSFTGPPDGSWPWADLVLDAQGNLYGTTSRGGAYGFGYGTVFMVTSLGTEKVVYSFTEGADGGLPDGGLILDEQGNLYGTTSQAGVYGYGTIFKLTP